MKNLIKKNQLMITALAIMLAIAGYLQFAGTNLDEEHLGNNGKTAEVSNTDGVITDNVALAKEIIYAEKTSDLISEYIKLLEKIF